MDADVDIVTLTDWYRRNARDLPWRAPGTAGWPILLSEVMLQQTPVARVAPIWAEWVTQWPRPSAMAASTPAEVLRAWGRLGYPRRALRLHECAEILATEHADRVPAEVDVLLTLPGIGDYTARAVACFAYGRRVPVVDTNVRRVIARAVHGRADAAPAARRDLADVEVLLPADPPTAAVFSAALMELGATVCTARNPACARCPLTRCAWRSAGKPTASGPKRRAQRYAGTDRQVRGLLLAVLRDDPDPVERNRLDLVWPNDPGQRNRALDSLLQDGLIEPAGNGRFRLPTTSRTNEQISRILDDGSSGRDAVE
ncbi:A/G-specific adenine glycosylase [Skermania piniformis]|uniref:A/G-specific adenine glycosylase n=1 Tax=Skermania pinensis TaxID=39122 RepID=UPI001FE9829C|nr:A/G-specific adenine glycosylase [Skermania piniformis]